jgi:regulator of RNase E activity RraA
MPTRVHRPATTPLPQEVVRQWGDVPAAVAADVLGGLTLVDPAIRPLRRFPVGGRLVGSVVTAFCEGTDYGPVQHAIAVAGPGDVILVEAGGRPNPAVIGEILGGLARRKGVAGVVVNGAVRDTGQLAQWPDFVVFTRHVTPRGPSSMDRGTVNDTIAFAGTRVAPHDLIVGDDDGLVVIPRAEALARLADARAKLAAEEAWERELASGRSNLDVFGVPPGI